MTTPLDVNTDSTPDHDSRDTSNTGAMVGAKVQATAVGELIALILTQLQAHTGQAFSHYQTTAHLPNPYGLDFWQAIADLLTEVAQRRTRDAELQFQADVLQQISEAVIAIDQDERITYLNAAAAAQYEIDPAAALGRPLSYIHQYKWLRPSDSLLAYDALAEHGFWRGENHHILRNGRTLYVESTVSVLCDHTGQEVGLLACVRDMTARKQAEAALQASETRYRQMANAMPHLIWTADTTGVVDYYNIRIHDYDGAVWQGDYGFDWQRLVHPDDLLFTQKTWQQAAARNDPYNCEHRLHMADGSWRWHLSRALPVRGEDQMMKWYGTATDIHERKVAEAALHASERQLNAILYNIPASVYILTTDHRYLLVNRIFEQENKITNAEIRGQSIYDRWPPAVADMLAANERQVIATKTPLEAEEAVPRNGEMHFYTSIKAPLLTETGEPYAIIGISTDITERKHAAEALRQSEERYRTLFETMDEGFCIFELLFDEANQPYDYRFLEVNPAFVSFTGLVDAVGKTARQLVPNLEAHWFEIYGHVALTGEARHFVEGSAAMGHWFDVHAFRFGGPESRRVALLFTNITARKAVEDALRASEEELRYTLELNPQVPWTADAAGNITSFNQRWLELTGLAHETALGAGWMQAAHPDDRPAMVAAWTHSLQTGEPYNLEHRILLADGQYRWMRSFAAPRRDETGAIVRWYGSTEDIHERKVAEAALREREARLHTILQNIPVSVYMLSTDQRYLFVNRYYEQLANITNREIQGKSIAEMFSPETAAALAANDQRALAAKVPLAVEEFAPQNGELHTYASIKTPLLDATGEPYAILGISTDITEHKRAEQIQQFLLDLDAQTRLVDDAALLMATAAQHLGDYLGVAHCAFGELDLAADQAVLLAHWRQRQDLPDLSGRHILSNYLAEPLTTVLMAGQRVTISQVAHDPCTAPFLPFYSAVGVQSLACVPFLVHGQRLAILAVAEDRARSWRPDEERLLESVIARVWPLVVRVRTEQALRTSEERLRLATEAGGVGIFDHDLLANRTEFSPIYARITGLPPDALLTREGWLALIHPEDRALVTAIWENAMSAGASYYYECRVIRPDGLWVWIEVNALLVLDEMGRSIRITGAIRDITASKQAALHQQFLLDLNATLRTLSDPAAIQQMVVKRLGEYLGLSRCRFNAIDLASDQATLLAAWSAPGEPAPRASSSLSAYASAAYIADAQAGRTLVVSNAATDSRPVTTRTLLLESGLAAMIRVPCLSDGQWVASLHVLQSSPRQWRSDEVQLVESVVHHFWPLVEKARTEKALRRSEERYRTLVQSSSEILWSADALAGYSQEAALWMEAFTGLPRPPVGPTTWWLQAIHPDEQETVRTLQAHALTRQQPLEVEFRLRHHSGDYRYVRLNSVPLYHADGSLYEWFGTLADITERRLVQEQLRTSEERLRLALAAARMATFEYNAVNQTVRRSANARLVQGLGETDAPGGYYTYVHQDDRDKLRAMIQGLTPAQNNYEFEYRFIRPDNGVTIWLLDRAQAHFDAQGQMLQLTGMVLDITERKTIEEALRAREAFLRAVTDAVPNLIGYIDRHHCYRFVNATYAQWFARPREQIEGHTMQELVGEEVNIWRQHWQRVLTGETVNFEETFTYPDGVTRTVMGTYIPDFGADGQILGIYLYINDITERKAAEAAVAAHAAELRVITDNILGFISYVDRELRYQFVNRAYEELYQQPREQIAGQSLRTLLGDAVYHQVQPYMVRALQGETVQFEATLAYVSGVRTIWATYVPDVDPHGSIQGFYALVTDISERKAVEEALRQSEETARQRLGELEAIYDTAPIGLCVLDRELRWVRINERLAEINGFPAAAHVGRSIRELLPALALTAEPIFRNILETNQPLLNVELHGQTPAQPGVERIWLEHWFPLHDSTGAVIGINVVAEEITERKRQERELKDLNATLEERVRERTAALQQANQDLARSNRELEQFNYAAAHDLKSPLRGIHHLVQWISEDAADVLTPASQKHLALLRGRVQRLETLLDDMLAYSRIGRIRYAPEKVDTNLLVYNIFDLLAPPPGFTLVVPTPLPLLLTMRAPLETVLRNLLSNAIKHHHQPNSGAVEVTAHQQGAWIEFTIGDNGPGIAPEFHDRIFGMFQTLQPRDQVEGSGIGLALVKKTLESYGGQITVESAKGAGTIFRFTWPT